jgi:hypothetical protein
MPQEQVFLSQRYKYALYFSVLILIVFLGKCRFPDEKTGQESSADTVYAALKDSTFYVGMETCRQCHQEIYDSYIQTGMGRSFGHATRTRSAAIFTSASIISDTSAGFYYHPFWKADTLFVQEFSLEGRDTSFHRQVSIDYIVGSGQHTNSHIRNVNGYLFQAPLTYYTQEGKWDLPPGFEGGFNSRFSRKIEMECLSCHNAMPTKVPGSENKYSLVPNGIDCERCHGPGSVHVKEKKAGIYIDTSRYIDFSIVNPAKLPVDLQMDVCQRCHIQGNAVLNEGSSFEDFKPGMRLSDVMNVFMPVFNGDPDAHIMASHAERLKMSKCFQVSSEKSKGGDAENLRPQANTLTCITCHNPHVSVKQTENTVFNAACMKCHTSGINSGSSESECKAPAAQRLAKGDNCVSCHMPSGNTVDIPHVSSTDHFIRRPLSVKEAEQIRQFAGLICINNPVTDDLTMAKAWISYYEKFQPDPVFLDSALVYMTRNERASSTQSYKPLIHLYFLKMNYRKVIELTMEVWGVNGFRGRMAKDNSDAWTAYRLGQSYEHEGEPDMALAYYRQASELAPFQLDFRNKLASLQHDMRMVNEAVENFNFILKENPEYVAAYTNLGFIFLSEFRDTKKAAIMYEKALELDPYNEQALLNKAGLLIYLGKNKEAADILKLLVKKYPDNKEAKNILRRL